ncbi:MAG TPA: hypothetical protein V6C86_24075 [Oculatellaceae cyanobacterium]
MARPRTKSLYGPLEVAMERSKCANLVEASAKWEIAYMTLSDFGSKSSLDLHLLIAKKAKIKPEEWLDLVLSEKKRAERLAKTG